MYDFARQSTKKFSLRNDEGYIYIEFMLREYRFDRKTGVVEWSENNLSKCCYAPKSSELKILFKVFAAACLRDSYACAYVITVVVKCLWPMDD